MNENQWLHRIALLWAGIVIGCSFIATPAKFQAPSLSLPTALEVGRATFRSVVVAELVLAGLGVFLIVRTRQKRPLFWLAVLALTIQWSVVMPFLNFRTDAIVHGQPSGGSTWHVAYILLEVVKVATLLVLSFRKGEAHGSN